MWSTLVLNSRAQVTLPFQLPQAVGTPGTNDYVALPLKTKTEQNNVFVGKVRKTHISKSKT